MFTATFNNAGSLLKKVVEIFKEHVPEAVMVISEEGIHMQSLDASHVALIDVFLMRDVADTYECNGTFELGLSFETLNKIFKCSSSTGTCTLIYDDEEVPDVLTVTFDGAEKKSSFEMKLLNIDVDRLEIPEETGNACEQFITSSELQKIMKDLAVFGDDVYITRKRDMLKFWSNGDAANAAIQMQIEDSFTGKVTSQYSLKYLLWFCKGQTLADEALLSIDKQNPMMLLFEKEDSFRLRFYLPPKISEVDDEEDEETDNEYEDDEEIEIDLE